MKFRQNTIISNFLIFAVIGVGSVVVLLTSVDMWNMLGKSVCLIMLAFLLIKSFRETVLLNPYLLFCVMPVTLIIYDSRISERYLDNLEGETWLLILLNLLMLFLGFYLTKPFRKINADWLGFSIYDDITSAKRLKFHFWLALGIGLLPSIYALCVGWHDLLGGNLYVMRNYFNMFPAASFLKFSLYFAIACAFKMKKKYYIAMAVLGQLASFMLLFSKLELLLLTMVLAICWLKYYKVNIKLSYVCVLFAVVVILFLWAFDFYDAMRTQGESMTDKLINRGDIIWNGPKSLAMPYMYLVQGWNNLQYVMQTQGEHSYGLWFFNPILHYMPIKFEGLQELEAPSFFNTFTFLGVQYKDFGIAGSSFVSVFLGFWIKKIYTMFLQSLSPLSICVYAINMVAILQMYFSNHFFMSLYPFTICILLLVYDVLLLKLKLR